MEKVFLKKLKSSNTKFVRILWCDNANIIRGKALHMGALKEEHIRYGVGISAGQQAVPVMFDGVMAGSGLGPVGEVRLVPDWSSLRPLPYAPGHARVMGDMMQKGKEWPCCSRFFLKKIIKEAKNYDIEIKAAFENEFYLLKGDTDEVVPVDNTHFASTQSMDINHGVISEIVNTLLAQDIQVEMYYPESGPGQQEITFHYSDPLKTADNQIVFRETVHAIAGKHGLKASFLPKIFPDKAGCGCHLHISLWRSGKNLIPDSKDPYGISRIGRSFIAGLLEYLPSLMALTTPSPNSYRRIKPHFWSGAFRCWGIDNREAPVRVLTSPDGMSINHFEFKTVDASSNPYLALGGVIAAGIDGIIRELDVKEPVDVDPGNLPEEERKSRGMDLLPQSLGSAIKHLEKNEFLLNVLGSELSKSYLTVKKAEAHYMKDFAIEDEAKLLLDKY